MNLFTKQKQKIRCRIQTYSYQGLGGDKLGDEDEYTLLYIKQITKKDLLCSTGRSTQYSVMTYMGKESKKHEYMYIYITDLLCCTPKINTTM